MINRYTFGNPIETEAVPSKPSLTSFSKNKTRLQINPETCDLEYPLAKDSIVYGLGENVRGINKRGFKYVSYCTDIPNHSEDQESLYGAHNFIIIFNPSAPETSLGIFIDTPGKVIFDIGFESLDQLTISVPSGSFDLYIISISENISLNSGVADSIVREFRQHIGRSYIAPKWAFGYGQSRWGYKCSEDIRSVRDEYQKLGLPLDMIYLDIDYMERYKDFTIDRRSYPDFETLVEEMRADGIRLIPIIDGGVKKESGYDVYEEGVKNGYFCKDEDGNDFELGVWPGACHYPDMLNDEARAWFGQKYKFLTDKGIEGFWNDMNEPAIFYSAKHLKEVFESLDEYRGDNLDLNKFFEFKGLVEGINNNPEDYRSFYHNYRGQKVLHDDVHNLFGYYMTRGAYEGLRKIDPSKRFLLFSRASYIGMHRYGGIWTGDNASIWSHLKLNLRMLPSLNMCGFLYIGADMGGFGSNTTEDLMLRWTALSIFTPLMRNHSALGTRDQEFYRFASTPLFKNLLSARYRLVPYLYSEYMKSVRDNTMMFRPLGFVYENDSIALEIEDQLLIGDEIMIAPVMEQNASGRVVYFPEEMSEIRFEDENVIAVKKYPAGFHYVELPLGAVNLFVRMNRKLPIGEAVASIDEVDSTKVIYYGLGSEVKPYELYDDDGVSFKEFG